MAQLLASAHKRGRAYCCLHCPKLNRPAYIAEKVRVESHVYKHHVQLDLVPYSCGSCLFHCTTMDQFTKHLTSYAWHRQRGSAEEEPLISPNPYFVGVEDMEVLSKEESVRHFSSRSRSYTPSTSPPTPDMLNSALKEAEVVLDYQDDVASTTSTVTEKGDSGEKVLLEIEVTDRDIGLDETRTSDLGAVEDEHPLDLRVVVAKPGGTSPGVGEGGESYREEDEPATQETGENLEAGKRKTAGDRREAKRPRYESSSSSSSSSSSESNSSTQRELIQALSGLVKQSADLVNGSVDRTMEMVKALAETVRQQNATLDRVSKRLENMEEERRRRSRSASQSGKGHSASEKIRSNGQSDGRNDRKQEEERRGRSRSAGQSGDGHSVSQKRMSKERSNEGNDRKREEERPRRSRSVERGTDRRDSRRDERRGRSRSGDRSYGNGGKGRSSGDQRRGRSRSGGRSVRKDGDDRRLGDERRGRSRSGDRSYGNGGKGRSSGDQRRGRSRSGGRSNHKDGGDRRVRDNKRGRSRSRDGSNHRDRNDRRLGGESRGRGRSGGRSDSKSRDDGKLGEARRVRSRSRGHSGGEQNKSGIGRREKSQDRGRRMSDSSRDDEGEDRWCRTKNERARD